jgi:hypothetical protein
MMMFFKRSMFVPSITLSLLPLFSLADVAPSRYRYTSKRLSIANVRFVCAGLEPISTRRPDNSDVLYRLALVEAIELFESQKKQINYTIVHFVNVWGAEDQGVKDMVAKLNNEKQFLTQSVHTWKTKLDREIFPSNERFEMFLQCTYRTLRTSFST